MVEEWDLIPLSLISQAGYCLRRAALIANEQLWRDNADTAKGVEEHRRTHTERIERRGDEISLYGYDVFSKRLGIGGKCDCIEASASADGCRIPAVDFPVSLYPVEHKHGKLRSEEEYELQLCAQAMCLEDMYGGNIPEGAIFYVSSHRRQTVALTPELRRKVLRTVETLEDTRRNFRIPPAETGAKCKRCSMRELCRPDLPTSAESYCQQLKKEAEAEASV